MCGFFVIIGPRGSLPVDAAVAKAMDTMKLRGPDGGNTERIISGDTEIVFGHRRLAVTGVNNGVQPIVHGRTVSVVNGEFYGWKEIRQRLEQRNISFTTDSDSEILPALYEAACREGAEQKIEAWLSELRGEWAFALFDRVSGALTAGCDEWGMKPLRWWQSPDGRTTAIATEAKTLFALGVPCVLDENSLRFAMQFQYLPWGSTLFKNVGMIPPGSCLKITPKETTRFMHIRHGHIKNTVDHDKQSSLTDIISEAVKIRIPPERPFCTHLSGGIDSAIVTALAVRLSGHRINGYCASFPWADVGDETAAARLSAQAIGAELCPVIMEPDALLAAMDMAPLYSEGLANNLHAGAKILVARQIHADGFRVAMTGEGADEAFLGYEHFRYDFANDVRPVNNDINPLSAGILRPLDDTSCMDIYGLHGAIGGTPAWIGLKAGAGNSMREAFGQRMKTVNFQAEDVAGLLPVRMRDDMKSMTGPARARLMWMMYAMSGYILRGLDDPSGMSAGVESRLPFLDRNVQSYAASITDGKHFTTEGLEKGLLREAAIGLLPESILKRPKRAFLVPSLLEHDIGSKWARDRLLGGRLIKAGLFTETGLVNLLSDTAAPVRDGNVYTLATLSNLMEHFDIR